MKYIIWTELRKSEESLFWKEREKSIHSKEWVIEAKERSSFVRILSPQSHGKFSYDPDETEPREMVHFDVDQTVASITTVYEFNSGAGRKMSNRRITTLSTFC